MALENLFIRTKRFLGSIQLDAVLRETLTNTIRVTKNPVELGVDINDHAIIEPKRYTMEGAVSDTPLGFAALENIASSIVDSVSGFFGDSTGEGATRSQAAYETLVALQETREPIEVQAGLTLLTNMLIENISVSQDKDTSRTLMFVAKLVEVQIVSTETISFPQESLSGSAKQQASSTIDKGRQAVEDRGSLLDSGNESAAVSLSKALGIL